MQTIEAKPLRRTHKPKNTPTTKYITLDNGEHHLMKAVPGYDELWVNDDGTVITHYGRVLNFSIIPRGEAKPGYRVVSVDGNLTYVHRVVGLAFHGQSSKRYVIHLDGNVQNNHYRNLTWGNPIDLYHTQKSLGIFPNRSLTAKIPANAVSDVQQRIEQGQTLSTIAKAYNVSDMSVHRFRKRHNI